jgi:YHS domain-containing protein
MFRTFVFVASVSLLGPIGWAQDQKTIDDQTHCPIMINKEVNAESEVVEYNGVKIRMCCDVCVERFNKYPEAYLLEEYIPQLNGMEIPPRAISQRFCPVYPDRVVTERDPYVMYQGHVVYLFNKAALRKWQKNPEKYAKAEILPQLKEPVDPKAEAKAAAIAAKYASDSSEDEEEDEDSGK